MTNLINLTNARNNLSKLIKEVTSEKKTYILIRDSVPQAVIIPYTQYQQQEETWKEEFNKCLAELREQFRKYLKKQGINYPRTEEAMYELVDKAAGRH